MFMKCSFEPTLDNPVYRSWRRRHKQDVTAFLNHIDNTVSIIPDKLLLCRCVIPQLKGTRRDFPSRLEFMVDWLFVFENCFDQFLPLHHFVSLETHIIQWLSVRPRTHLVVSHGHGCHPPSGYFSCGNLDLWCSYHKLSSCQCWQSWYRRFSVSSSWYLCVYRSGDQGEWVGFGVFDDWVTVLYGCMCLLYVFFFKKIYGYFPFFVFFLVMLKVYLVVMTTKNYTAVQAFGILREGEIRGFITQSLNFLADHTWIVHRSFAFVQPYPYLYSKSRVVRTVWILTSRSQSCQGG